MPKYLDFDGLDHLIDKTDTRYLRSATTSLKGMVELMTDSEMDSATGGTSPTASENPIVDLIYPVGSIYMSTSSTSPSVLFTGTTWARIQGRFLLGAGSNTANTSTTYGSLSAGAINRTTIGEQGGEVSHLLTTEQIPSHYHNGIKWAGGTTITLGTSGGSLYGLSYGSSNNDGKITTEYTGGSQAHNNMPPYFVVYIWRRLT